MPVASFNGIIVDDTNFVNGVDVADIAFINGVEFDLGPDVPTDEVVRWEFDEASGDALDSVGSITLTNNNASARVPGKFINAAQLVAASLQTYSCTSNATVNAPAGSFTWCLWVNPTTGGLNTDGWIDKELCYRISSNSSNQVFFRVYEDTTFTIVQATSTDTVTPGAWNFIACWYDVVTKRVSIQINNGTPVVSATAIATTVSLFASLFQIGINNQFGWASGLVDRTQKFNRVLTDDERTALFSEVV